MDERTITLIRLDDHVFAIPDIGDRTQLGTFPSNEITGLNPAVPQEVDDHRRRRRLSVRTRYRNGLKRSQECGEHLPSSIKREIHLACAFTLGMIQGYRGGSDHQIQIGVEQVRIVTHMDPYSPGLQPIHQSTGGLFRTLDPMPTLLQESSQARHAHAPDTDHMNAKLSLPK
jgi:hypothetical protein